LLDRLGALALLGLALAAAAPALAAEHYDVNYHVSFLPRDGAAGVTIAVEPHGATVSRLTLRMDPQRYSQVRGDGKLEIHGDSVVWEPPATGGALHYRYRIDHQRKGGGYDARITPTWTIVRGDDLVPPLTVRSTKGSDSRARLSFSLPEGWTNVDTPYRLAANSRDFVVVDPRHRFDRPVGWMIAGAVGTRREFIEGCEFSVGGPKGEHIRRNDMIAIANLVLPQMKRAFGELPTKLLVVSAGDPMWRGGLSGPRSLYLHADRPLFSENGTSSLVHELTHAVTRIRGAKDDDWIAEGLAEYYSIELPRRAGLLSASRSDKAIDWMRHFGKSVDHLRVRNASGQVTARAVVLFHELDREIEARTNGDADLDNVVRALIERREVSLVDLRDAAERVLGAPVKALQSPLLAEKH
jgi:predicted metalloprotease with PDZ domain